MAAKRRRNRPTLNTTQPSQPTNKNRRWLWLAALAALVLGWLLSSQVGFSTRETSPRPASTITIPRVTASAHVTEGTDVTWHDFAGLDLPVSATSGPRCLTATRAACFAHDDVGAAFAAVHLLARTFPFAGRASFAPTIAEQVVGRDQPTLARLTEQSYATTEQASAASKGEAKASDAGSAAGFYLDDLPWNYAPIVVHVLIHETGSEQGDSFIDFTVQLTWQNDDWRLIAPNWGDWETAAQPMPTADPGTYRSYDDPSASSSDGGRS